MIQPPLYEVCQNEENKQRNSNRNPPLGITDPDGDALHWAIQGAIGAASGVLSNGLGNLSSGRDFFDGAGKAAAWGAVSAFASFGIGEVFKGAAASVSKELWRGYAHALVQGNIPSWFRYAISKDKAVGCGSPIDILSDGVNVTATDCHF